MPRDDWFSKVINLGVTPDNSTSVACSFSSEQFCSRRLLSSLDTASLQEQGCSELKLQATEVEVSGVTPDYLTRGHTCTCLFSILPLISKKFHVKNQLGFQMFWSTREVSWKLLVSLALSRLRFLCFSVSQTRNCARLDSQKLLQ